MNKDQTPLASCPFCGAAATLESHFGREWWAQCSDLDCCGASDGRVFDSPSAAETAWNRRSEVEAARAQTAAEPKDLYARIYEALLNHGLQHTRDEDDCGLPLVDALTRYGDKDIRSGMEEVELLADALFDAVEPLYAAPSSAPAPHRSELPNRGLLQAAKQALSALKRHGQLPWGTPEYPTPNPGCELLYEAQSYLEAGIKREEEWRAVVPPVAAPAPGVDAQDATRYRWLRDMAWGVPHSTGLTDIQFPTLPHKWMGHKKDLSNIDAVIDARIAALRGVSGDADGVPATAKTSDGTPRKAKTTAPRITDARIHELARSRIWHNGDWMEFARDIEAEVWAAHGVGKSK